MEFSEFTTQVTAAFPHLIGESEARNYQDELGRGGFQMQDYPGSFIFRYENDEWFVQLGRGAAGVGASLELAIQNEAENYNIAAIEFEFGH